MARLMIAKRWIVLAGVIVALVVVGGVLLVQFTTSTPGESATSPAPATPSDRTTSPEREEISRWDPGSQPPESAVESAHRLVAPDPAERRSALTPELNEALPSGGDVPAGADVVLDADGWREHDGYAIATGRLVVPNVPDQQIVIGFKIISGQWLITFQEDVS